MALWHKVGPAGGALTLFVLTFVSMVASQVPLATDEPVWMLPALVLEAPMRAGPGVLYAAALMLILLAHELGHIAAARAFDVPFGWPVFIPAPTLFGTLGAVVPLKARAPHRRALLWLSASGPLAGAVVALPIWLWGMRQPNPASTDVPMLTVGKSLLTGWTTVGDGALGDWGTLPPLALAGWVGLFFTGLNLLPIGPLDGGNIAYALWGKKFERLSGVMAAALFAYGLIASLTDGLGPRAPSCAVWSVLAVGLWLWGLEHPGVQDSQAPLGPREHRLATVALAALLLTFVSAPLHAPSAPQAPLAHDLQPEPTPLPEPDEDDGEVHWL